MLVYNRPEKYFPERDEILERQGAPRPHCFVICIVLHPTSHFKIRVIDSWYVRSVHKKKTIIEEASIYLRNLINIFLELKGKSPEGEILIEEKHLIIIPSKMQEDKYSCGDFSIEAVKCIIENKIWVKTGNNKDQRKLKNLDITSTRWRIKNIIDGFQMELDQAQKQDEKKKRAAKYDLKKILRDTESRVIRECADTSTAIDTIDGFTLFKKKDVRLDPNYLTMSDKEKTERELRISRKYEKYLLMFLSQIKKKRNRRVEGGTRLGQSFSQVI